MASFYLTLPSNVKNDYHQNTVAHYKTNLPRKYVFPIGEDWEVALVEISYPKSWFTIDTPQKITLFTGTHRNHGFQSSVIDNNLAYLPPGHYLI